MPNKQSPRTDEIVRDLLNYIRMYQSANRGASPSRRDIMNEMKFSSTSVSNYYLEVMVKQKMIEPLIPHRPRTIMIVGGKKEFDAWICPQKECDRFSKIPNTCPKHRVDMVFTILREV